MEYIWNRYYHFPFSFHPVAEAFCTISLNFSCHYLWVRVTKLPGFSQPNKKSVRATTCLNGSNTFLIWLTNWISMSMYTIYYCVHIVLTHIIIYFYKKNSIQFNILFLPLWSHVYWIHKHVLQFYKICKILQFFWYVWRRSFIVPIGAYWNLNLV